MKRTVCLIILLLLISLDINAAQDVNLVPLKRIVTSGTRTVAATGSSVSIVASSTPVYSCSVKALASNTGLIYIGNSSVSSSSYQLDDSESVEMDIDDASDIYIDGSINNEGVTFICIK